MTTDHDNPTPAMLASLPVESRIWFEGEARPYRVRATDGRFLICTKPFNPMHTVLYCILDVQEMVRAPENLIFGAGAETDEECNAMLARLTSNDLHERTELSRRRTIDARVTRVRIPGGGGGGDPRPEPVAYATDLCLRMMAYAAFDDKHGDMTVSEVRAALAPFFTHDTLDAAVGLMKRGCIPPRVDLTEYDEA